MEKSNQNKNQTNLDPVLFPPKINPGAPSVETDPPVPNRAWVEMRLGRDVDELTEEEKRELYLGRDNYF